MFKKRTRSASRDVPTKSYVNPVDRILLSSENTPETSISKTLEGEGNISASNSSSECEQHTGKQTVNMSNAIGADDYGDSVICTTNSQFERTPKKMTLRSSKSTPVGQTLHQVSKVLENLSKGKQKGNTDDYGDSMDRIICTPQPQFEIRTAREKVLLRSNKSAPVGHNVSKDSSPIQLSSIKIMDGTNYKDWKKSMRLYLENTTMDLALREEEPPILTESTATEKAYREIWEHSNRACLTLMNYTMDIPPTKQKILKGDKGKVFLKSVSENFKALDKEQKDRYFSLLEKTKYDGVGGVREHLTNLVHYYNKLNSLNVELGRRYLNWKVIESLPPQFDALKTSYKSQIEELEIEDMIDIISQDEESMEKEIPHNAKFSPSGSGTKNKKNKSHFEEETTSKKRRL